MCDEGRTGALLKVCQMLESENLRHEFLNDGQGAAGEGQIRKERHEIMRTFHLCHPHGRRSTRLRSYCSRIADGRRIQNWAHVIE